MHILLESILSQMGEIKRLWLITIHLPLNFENMVQVFLVLIMVAGKFKFKKVTYLKISL